MLGSFSVDPFLSKGARAWDDHCRTSVLPYCEKYNLRIPDDSSMLTACDRALIPLPSLLLPTPPLTLILALGMA